MNVCSSVGQRLKSLKNEPKRRRNYVREKDIFHSHYERFISGAIQLLLTFPSVWLRLTAFASAWQRLPALYFFSIRSCQIGIFVKRQLKFDKPRYLLTKTHKPKTKTHLFYDKNNALYIFNRKNIIIIWNNGLNNLWNDYFSMT